MNNNNTTKNMPPYQLKVTNGEYPFKNAQISKIFNVVAIAELQIEKSILHRMVQVYNSLQSPLLIPIKGLHPISQTDMKIQYEYIDTSLSQYIKQYLHQNIEIKLQKFFIELRNMANQFVLKNVNIIKALNFKNIGVKRSDIYRETICGLSAAKRQNKQISMPNFKVYIDFSKCQIIQKTQNIGRVVIQTDKIIYNTICAQINNLVLRIQTEQSQKHKRALSYYQFYSQEKINSVEQIAVNKIQNFQNHQDAPISLAECQFSNKIKRRKKRKNQRQNANIFDNEEQLHPRQTKQIKIKMERAQTAKPKDESGQFYRLQAKQLNIQVNSILQKSRKALQTFKQKIKNTQ